MQTPHTPITLPTSPHYPTSPHCPPPCLPFHLQTGMGFSLQDSSCPIRTDVKIDVRGAGVKGAGVRGAGVSGNGVVGTGVKGAGVRGAGVKEGGGRGQTCSSAHGPRAGGRHSPSTGPLEAAQEDDGQVYSLLRFPKDYRVTSHYYVSCRCLPSACQLS